MRGYLVGQDGLCHADIPEPDDPGSNEVLIEVKAVSLNSSMERRRRSLSLPAPTWLEPF